LSHEVNQPWLKLSMQGWPWSKLELHDRHGELAREGRDGEGEEKGVGERLLAVGVEGAPWGSCMERGARS
jgi:hypothetical protein